MFLCNSSEVKYHFMSSSDTSGVRDSTADQLLALKPDVRNSVLVGTPWLVQQGAVLHVGGADYTVPAWLRRPLPRRIVLEDKRSVVDLSLPIEGNMFSEAMSQHIQEKGMLEDLSSNDNFSFFPTHS